MGGAGTVGVGAARDCGQPRKGVSNVWVDPRSADSRQREKRRVEPLGEKQRTRWPASACYPWLML